MGYSALVLAIFPVWGGSRAGVADTLGVMRFRCTSRAGRTTAALLPLVLWAGVAVAQGQPVDRGTGDLGPNSVSQRVIERGIGQFSPEAALVDRYVSAPTSFAADFYAGQQATGRRYLYRAPGITALYNQSSYLTQDGMGVIGINGTNGGNGRAIPIVTSDMVYVLSPELLDQQQQRAAETQATATDDLGRQVYATPIGGTAGGRLDTQVTAHTQADILDIAAIHAEMRRPQRDPRLVERARRWREERERAEQEAQRVEAQSEEPAEPASEPDTEDDAPADDTPSTPVTPSGE